jgi:hypothetical protein
MMLTRGKQVRDDFRSLHAVIMLPDETSMYRFFSDYFVRIILHDKS